MNSKIYLIFSIIWISFSASQGTDIKTPLEKNNYSKLSGYEEMIEYLRRLETSSKKIRISIIGQSVQGRDIPALFFTNDEAFAVNRKSKPVVLVFCQQHGNEPSGKEAALIVARRLIKNSNGILDKIDLMLVPQVNPDGSEMEQRRNANNIDLNRNHVILSEPESNAIHQLFLEWMPEISLDIHEYNAIAEKYSSKGFVKDAEEMLGGITNLNIDPEIMHYSRDKIIPEVGEHVCKDGFTFHRYIVGDPFEHDRVRYSTTAINDGRQSMGIYNTFSFIIEGKKYGDVITHIERRTKGQVSALVGFLSTIANHAEDILKLVKSARLSLEAGNNKKYSHLKMDYFPDPSRKTLTFPVFNLNTWKREERKFEHFEPLVKIIKSVEWPGAYIFSQNEEKLRDLLKKHQIKFFYLSDTSELEVETYTILHVTPTREEDKSSEYIDVLRKNALKKFAKGDIVVFLNQKAANLIPLLLEPQSSWGIVSESGGGQSRFKEYLQENSEYPIYRVSKSASVDLSSFTERKDD